MRQLCILFLLMSLCVIHCSYFAEPANEVQLPSIFSNNMVLQQNEPIPIWGKATPEGKVTVLLNKTKRGTTANEDSTWSLELPAMEVGGPHKLQIVGKDTITFENVMVGEVWVCSGQSNMQWQVAQSQYAEREIAEATYPDIRLFTVERTTSINPQEDVQADAWEVCSPETVPTFSAVAYFFGRHLLEELQIPIGLIHSSWGGTVAEAWTAPDFLGQMEDFAPALLQLQSTAQSEEKARSAYEQQLQEWQEAVDSLVAATQSGPNWQSAQVNDSSWQQMTLPVLWESAGLANLDGVVWFRKTVQIADSLAEESLILSLGPIDDQDVTYFNGQKIGETNLYDIPREYKVPADIIQAGENIIAVRVLDTGGGGGIWGTPEQMYLQSQNDTKIDLPGNWLYKVGATLQDVPPRPQTPDSPNRPAVLYNAMIEPLMPFAIRGVIWYQGESNAGRAFQYRTLFPTMIESWRANWGQSDFPFLFVQLANFRARQTQPVESEWAELREAQMMTLALPNTGMAVIIDIGDAEDIHPRNKQDVGKRLGLIALAQVYDRDVIYYGPTYDSMSIEDNQIRLEFDFVDGGLMANADELEGFAIAGEDSSFVWGNAAIDGETVVVSHPDIENPQAVRYGWADNPLGNLYNKAGLPASPFRTDDWEGITKDAK